MYREYKNGKSRSVTIIKRIEGNLLDLKRNLSDFIPGDRIDVKQSKLVINGDYVQPVRDWLTLNKF